MSISEERKKEILEISKKSYCGEKLPLTKEEFEWYKTQEINRPHCGFCEHTDKIIAEAYLKLQNSKAFNPDYFKMSNLKVFDSCKKYLKELQKYTLYDPINHPKHYTQHPSGVECIQITEHMNFNLGNAIKYIWRSGLKGNEDNGVEDLKKAKFYIEREISRLEKQ
jgi:hypothetical protein